MKHGKKTILVLTVAAWILVGAACGKEAKEQEPTPTVPPTAVPTQEPTPDPTPVPTEPPRDLGGLEVVLCDTYSGDNWDTAYNSYLETFYDMFHKAEQEHNFKFKRKGIGGWGDQYADAVSLSIIDDKPLGYIFSMDSRFISSFVTKGLALDVSQAKSVNWDDDKWNQGILEVMKVNGGTYGFSCDRSGGAGLWINKDLLRQLNVDPNLIYDLQKEGQWNWEKFLELCGSLTKDTNNDGKYDTWAVCGQEYQIVYSALLSNGTFVINKNEAGLLSVNADDPAVAEAMDFIQKLKDSEYLMKKKKDDSWDWYRAAFNNGQAVMRIETLSGLSGEQYGLGFEYGFVTFPYGPKAGKNVNAEYLATIYFVPNTTATKEKMDDIMYVYNWYTTEPDGSSTPTFDKWKNTYSGWFKEGDRSLSETLSTLFIDSETVMPATTLIPDFLNDSWTMDLINGKSYQDVLSTSTPRWEGQVNIFNSQFK